VDCFIDAIGQQKILLRHVQEFCQLGFNRFAFGIASQVLASQRAQAFENAGGASDGVLVEVETEAVTSA